MIIFLASLPCFQMLKTEFGWWSCFWGYGALWASLNKCMYLTQIKYTFEWEYLWKSMKSMKSMANKISHWFLETYLYLISPKINGTNIMVRTWCLQKLMRQKCQIYLRSPRINQILIDFWTGLVFAELRYWRPYAEKRLLIWLVKWFWPI